MSSATEGFHIPGPRRPTCSRLPHSPRRRNKYLSVPPWLGTNHQGVGNRHECLFVKAISIKFGP